MPLPHYLLVKGKPASVNASYTVKKAWKDYVNAIAKGSGFSPIIAGQSVSVEVVHFPPQKIYADVDNILKYTLDGMIGAIYKDDRLVTYVTSTRVPSKSLRPIPCTIEAAPTVVAALLEQKNRRHAVAIRISSPPKAPSRVL